MVLPVLPYNLLTTRPKTTTNTTETQKVKKLCEQSRFSFFLFDQVANLHLTLSWSYPLKPLVRQILFFSETGSLMVDPIGFAHNSNLSDFSWTVPASPDWCNCFALEKLIELCNLIAWGTGKVHWSSVLWIWFLWRPFWFLICCLAKVSLSDFHQSVQLLKF